MKPEIFTPVISVLTEDDKFDIDANLKVMDYLIKNGVDGIAPLGSTGEYTWFPKNQKMEYLNEYIDAAAGRTQIIAGVGGVEYKDTIEVANFVAKKNVKGVLAISEFYCAMSQKDLYTFYAHLAERIETNVYIYNYPARTGSSISGDTVAALAAKYPNIKGLKDSVQDFAHTKDILDKALAVRPDFEVYSGYDNYLLDNVANGGAGNISALSNFVPDIWSAWVKAVRENDAEGMAAGQKKIDKLMAFYSLESNPFKLIKETMRRQGLDISTHAHFPFDYLTEGSVDTVLKILEECRK